MVEKTSIEPPSLEAFERAQNLSFNNKALLQQAFVHRSFVNEQKAAGQTNAALLLDNERLEFLGDAIISFLTSEYLYRNFPNDQEGALTHIRTRLVRRETLAAFSKAMQVGKYLRLGIGEEETGGRERTATLCATFEAIIGALYMDQGIEVVREFLQQRVEAELVRTGNMSKDPKTRLQEWVQETMGVTPRYRPIDATGPDHARVFTMLCKINQERHGVGMGKTKQDATQAAAAMALFRFGQPAPEYVPDRALETKYEFLDPSPPPSEGTSS